MGLAFLFVSSLLHAEPLQVLAEDEAPPYSYNDGSGFANEVVRAAFAAAGVDVTLLPMPYARCKEMTLDGEAPACLSMAWDPAFEGKIAFPDKPLYECRADYYCNSDRPLNAKTESELTGKIRIGTVTGYEYPPAVYRLRDKGLIDLESARSEELNLKKLMRGRIDAVLLVHNDIKSVEFLMARAGVAGKVTLAFSGGRQGSYIGFSTTHAQGPWARDRFNEGYRIIEANGALENIRTRWVSLLNTEQQRQTESVSGRSGTNDVPTSQGRVMP